MNKRLNLHISGDIEEGREKEYDHGLLEVLTLPDEIDFDDGKNAIHVTHSTDLRLFCQRNKVPLFVCRAREGIDEKEIRFTFYAGKWFFAYTDEYDTD